MDMSTEKLKLFELTELCKDEIHLFFRGQDIDARCCYEVFRRCFEDRDECAWEQAYILFEPQVSRWVRSHHLFYNTGEEESYFTNRAFEKIWAAIPPKKFEKFKNIKQVLSYLKMCVASAIVDYYRNHERTRLGLEKLKDLIDIRRTSTNLPSKGSDLWQFAKKMMKDENERLVLYASFVLGLKPKEMILEYPGYFENIKEIYQTKENILARLRRSSELKDILSESVRAAKIH
jgi:hypothetical protein